MRKIIHKVDNNFTLRTTVVGSILYVLFTVAGYIAHGVLQIIHLFL